jgi:hypothetical protein
MVQSKGVLESNRGSKSKLEKYGLNMTWLAYGLHLGE